MNASIPPPLAPYIHECVQSRSLTLLTSVLDTPANWLLARFIIASASTRQQRGTISTTNCAASAHPIILVSIWRSQDVWTELLRKCGLNLQDAITSGKVCYIDGLSASSQPLRGVINLENLALKNLDTSILKAQQHLATQDPNSKATILIDGLDLLLATQTSMTSIGIHNSILALQSLGHSVVLTCAADSALLHNTDASATPLEIEHASLIRILAHNASWVFQLRPLETGQSKEVSGSIRVSKGGAWESVEKGDDLEDGEWLYHFKGDGTVKVWARGEA